MNDDDQVAKEKLSSLSTGSYGYGGKYGVEKDRMDKVIQFSSALSSVIINELMISLYYRVREREREKRHVIHICEQSPNNAMNSNE